MEFIRQSFPLLARGGWLMLPILALSIIALGIILERFWVLVVRRSRILPRGLVDQVIGRIKAGELNRAVEICERDSSVMARILLAGLKNSGASREIMREYFEETARREGRTLERYLGALGAIAGVAPLLGLLGTVIGMIEIFNKIAEMKLGQYGALAHGIHVALYTTAFGLIVAIPSYLAYKSYGGMVDNYLRDMEEEATHVMDLLVDFNQGKAAAPGKAGKEDKLPRKTDKGD